MFLIWISFLVCAVLLKNPGSWCNHKSFLDVISWEWEDLCGGSCENELVAELSPGEETWLYPSWLKGSLSFGNQLAELNYVQKQHVAQAEKELWARLKEESKGLVSAKSKKRKSFSINTEETTRKSVLVHICMCLEWKNLLISLSQSSLIASIGVIFEKD